MNSVCICSKQIMAKLGINSNLPLKQFALSLGVCFFFAQRKRDMSKAHFSLSNSLAVPKRKWRFSFLFIMNETNTARCVHNFREKRNYGI